MLSRVTITGMIDESIPLPVILEIADAHGLRYDSNMLNRSAYIRTIVETINNTVVASVSTNASTYTMREYQAIARFVNRHCHNWQVGILMRAFAFLQHYMNNNYDLPAEPDFPYGLANLERPTSFNACILFKLCRHYRINLTRTTTLDEMAMAIRLLIQPLPLLRTLLHDRINTGMENGITNAHVINLLMSMEGSNFSNLTIPRESPQVSPSMEMSVSSVSSNDTPTYENLETTNGTFQNHTNVLKCVLPANNAEAIVLGAINYKIDLSRVSNPIREYMLLGNTPYVPGDVRLREIIHRNRNYLRLDINFNPNLPPSLYSQETIRNLAAREGYQATDLVGVSPYELLQVAYLSNTFYAGYQDGIINQQTPISYDDLTELDNDVIICYGTKGSSLTAMRYAELTGSFRTNRNFRNPLTQNSIFEALPLRKLKILVSTPHPGESAVATREREELRDAIRETELFYDGNNVRARELYDTYMAGTEQQKTQIRQCITYLFEMGMYMRGWDGLSRYPIVVAPVINRGTVDIAVTNAITRFENKCAEVGSIGTLIMNLPLLQYRGDFLASSDPNQGLTIRDRVNIVRAGDNNANIASCIRLSSNWFAATAYRYMQIIGMPPPFEIESLTAIH